MRHRHRKPTLLARVAAVVAAARSIARWAPHRPVGVARALSVGRSRRDVLLGGAATATLTLAGSSPGWLAPEPAAAVEGGNSKISTAFSSYRILPDASERLEPTLRTVAPSELTRLVSMTDGSGGGGAVRGGAL